MHEKKSQFILLKIPPLLFRLLGKIQALSIEVLSRVIMANNLIWAASWQNQQNDCAPSENSDQTGRMIRVFAVRMNLPTHWAHSEVW